MKRLLCVIGAVAVSSAANGAVAEPAHTLDLLCKGQQMDAASKARRKWTAHYRVDTDQLKWCEGRCETLSDIQKATDDALVFDQQAAGMLTISRSKGSLRQDGGEVRIEAQCKAAKFSGFPKARF